MSGRVAQGDWASEIVDNMATPHRSSWYSSASLLFSIFRLSNQILKCGYVFEHRVCFTVVLIPISLGILCVWKTLYLKIQKTLSFSSPLGNFYVLYVSCRSCVTIPGCTPCIMRELRSGVAASKWFVTVGELNSCSRFFPHRLVWRVLGYLKKTSYVMCWNWLRSPNRLTMPLKFIRLNRLAVQFLYIC